MSTIDTVKQILADVLQINVKEYNEHDALLGHVPEFDSMTVVAIITSLEEKYEFDIEDDEINAEVFETIGSLVVFVDSKLKALNQE